MLAYNEYNGTFNCSKCCRKLSNIEKEFLIKKFSKIFNCVQCLSDDKDKKLELSFYNYKYLNKNVFRNSDENYEYKFKYEEFKKKVDKILEITKSNSTDEAIKIFLEQKEDLDKFIEIINNNELCSVEDLIDLIKDSKKYKDKYNYIKSLIKKHNIIEEDKFFDFLENYKKDNIYYIYSNKEKDVKLVTCNQECHTNINDKNIRLHNNPIFKYDLLDTDYKHFKNKLNLYKLLKNCKKLKNNKNNIENKKVSEINVFDLRKNVNDLVIKFHNISNDLNEMEKELNELQKIEPIFNKLKNNINILDNNIDDENEIMKLFSKLKNDKINEYKTMMQIGEKLLDKDIDENLKNNLSIFNDRNDRIILKCKRIYLLSKYINIECIALSKISHFIRDSNINTFNCLLNMLHLNINSITSLFM